MVLPSGILSAVGRVRMCLLLGVLLSCAIVSSAEASLQIAAPGATPKFRPGNYDYTIPCQHPFRLRVHASGRTQARIGEGGWFSGVRERSVRLVPGQAIEVARRDATKKRYWVRCLPADFPKYSFKRYAKPSAPLYIVSPLPTDATPNYAFIYNRWGVPVWWSSRQVGANDAKVLSDGSIVWTHYLGGGFGVDPTVGYDFHRPNGKLVKTLRAVGSPTDIHELQPTPDGNYMLITYRVRSGLDTSAFNGDADASVQDGVVQKLSPRGKLLSEWSTADHIGLAETGRWWGVATNEPYDIVHVNAVQPLKNGDFLVSMRHTDAVYRVDGTSGEIEWKLGGSQTPKSLNVLDDPFSANPLGGQHDVRLVSGTVSIHDNGTFLHPPRAVRYRISGSTATLVDSLSDPLAPNSICCGSARYSTDGSWLMSWGGDPIVTEFNRKRRRSFLLRWDGNIWSYRAVAVRDGVTRSQLVAGMNAQFPPEH